MSSPNAFGTRITGLKNLVRNPSYPSRSAVVFTRKLGSSLKNDGSSNQAQAYMQWKTRINQKLSMTGGFHFNYFKLINLQAFKVLVREQRIFL